MLFSSLIFLWVFLPIVLIGNAILSYIPFSDKEKRMMAKNVFLLCASLIFYAWGGVSYLFLLLSVVLIDYASGLLMEKVKDHKKMIFILTIAINIGLLIYFKYFNLMVSVAEALAGREPGGFGLKSVILPIGISFYIFQALSYVIDAYRGKTEVQHNILLFALYVSLFPQLVAGPIVIYEDIRKQLLFREESKEKFVYGIRRFCYGLAKKVIIANAMAEAADGIWTVLCEEGEVFGAGVALWGMITYTLQIYYDFSGYSDMAIGMGSMLGFSFKENFDHPYISGSVREFWRRWHISLSSWFRDYVYIPLGGSRGKSDLFTYRNLLIVFFLTGVWHGANFTFFSWGLYYGVLIVIERAFLGEILDKNKFKVLNHIYTMAIVMVGWVLFRAPSIGDALIYLKRLTIFEIYPYTILNFLSLRIIIAFIAGIICMGPFEGIAVRIGRKIKETGLADISESVDFVFQMVLLACCVLLIISSSYNPFIYFQF